MLVPVDKASFFNKLADIIEEHGWIQQSYYSKDGFCVLGARNKLEVDVIALGSITLSNLVVTDGVRGLLNKYSEWLVEFSNWIAGIKPEANDSVEDLIKWNDADGRTKEEVVLTIRKYAEEMCHA